jgi:hypothetical protein
MSRYTVQAYFQEEDNTFSNRRFSVFGNTIDVAIGYAFREAEKPHSLYVRREMQFRSGRWHSPLRNGRKSSKTFKKLQPDLQLLLV